MARAGKRTMSVQGRVASVHGKSPRYSVVLQGSGKRGGMRAALTINTRTDDSRAAKLRVGQEVTMSGTLTGLVLRTARVRVRGQGKAFTDEARYTVSLDDIAPDVPAWLP